MAGTEVEKARGAFFTPAPIARYLAEWAIRAADDSVLEPSCGEAVFLRAGAARLREIESDLYAEPDLSGVEIHAPSVATAHRLLSAEGASASIAHEDFFTYSSERQFDAILGNPPFIRYQDFTGSARARSLEAALQQGVRLSGLSSSWAAFVVKAAQHLAPTGRLGLVLPAELLSVGYAAEIRRFLLKRFAAIRLVVFEERIFPGVLEDVVLLMAEGTGGADHFELLQAKNAEALSSLGSEPVARFTPGAQAKWTPALVARDAFAHYQCLQAECCESLSAWGRTYLGAVTGNNSFFAMSQAEVARLGLNKRTDLVRISSPGSRHLRGATFAKVAWEKARDQGARTFLFRPAGNPSDAGLSYIKSGEKAGVQKAYKCRVRAPWWRVPLVDVPDLFLTYMSHDRPRLIANEAGVYILNSVFGVKLIANRRAIGMKLLPIAALNSVTLLGAEVVGRSYGGGLLKLEPREADKLPVPALARVADRADELSAIAPQLATAMRSGDLDAACRLVDPIVFPAVSDEILQALRTARELLFERRRTRAGNGKG